MSAGYRTSSRIRQCRPARHLLHMPLRLLARARLVRRSGIRLRHPTIIRRHLTSDDFFILLFSHLPIPHPSHSPSYLSTEYCRSNRRRVVGSPLVCPCLYKAALSALGLFFSLIVIAVASSLSSRIIISVTALTLFYICCLPPH